MQKNPKSDYINNDDSKSAKIKVKALKSSKTIVTSITDTTATSVPIAILAKNNITNIIHESTMTRKTRNKQVREAAIDACSIKTNNDDIKPNSEKCGYCEKCRVEYDVLAQHLQSKEHLNFVKNNDNYIALDSLINSGTTNVENFLKINSGQIIDESERNGVHSPKSPKSPKRESLITSRVNYLNRSVDKDATITAKSHRQMNGIVNHSNDDTSPTKLNNVRDKLPKYSPPITRRSQTKNSIQMALDDSQSIETNTKPQLEKLNSITVDFKEHELNFISKAGKVFLFIHIYLFIGIKFQCI